MPKKTTKKKARKGRKASKKTAKTQETVQVAKKTPKRVLSRRKNEYTTATEAIKDIRRSTDFDPETAVPAHSDEAWRWEIY